MSNDIPEWLKDHRALRPYRLGKAEAMDPRYSRKDPDSNRLLADVGFNNHEKNSGKHVSPYDEGRVLVGLDGLTVRLIQGVNEEAFTDVLSRALRATTGIPLSDVDPPSEVDREEMLRGGLQAALETQTIVFEVTGASRALTHQLVRTRKAGFHQQSQRATWYGDRPNFRMPQSVFVKKGEISVGSHGFANGFTPPLREIWDHALLACWEAYKAACDAGVSYQDARYILPEGTTNYILCEYPLLEFLNVFAYRGCSMFLWEMTGVMREMRRVLLQAHPFLEPHVKISCEKTGEFCKTCQGSGYLHAMDNVPATTEEVTDALTADDPKYEVKSCWACEGRGGTKKCTFQGWENVEGACDFPWARQDNRTFLPNPKFRIGG